MVGRRLRRQLQRPHGVRRPAAGAAAGRPSTRRPAGGSPAAERDALRPWPHIDRHVHLLRRHRHVEVQRAAVQGAAALRRTAWRACSPTRGRDRSTRAAAGSTPRRHRRRRRGAELLTTSTRNRAISSYDIPHILTWATIWELPFGRGKRWLTDGAAVDDPRQLAAELDRCSRVRASRSPSPWAAIRPTSATPATRAPNLVGDPELDNPTADRWFNTAAFAMPVNAFGDAGRNILRAPGYLERGPRPAEEHPRSATRGTCRSASRRSTCSTTSTSAIPVLRSTRRRHSGGSRRCRADRGSCSLVEGCSFKTRSARILTGGGSARIFDGTRICTDI